MSRTPYRVLVALLAIAIPAAPARAQAGPQFLGQIGFSSARIGGSPEANDFKSRNGFFGGIGVGITRENGLGGRIEVNYEQKGVELPKEAEVRNGVQLGYI
ncbi:MAG TPA: hypothetical protein VLL51_10890, partial [Gemmatimonadales bacterium]|nr:hypothetical protein [Gemmatimonadales bacterium]